MKYVNKIAEEIVNKYYDGDHNLDKSVAKYIIHDSILYSLVESNVIECLAFHNGTAIQRVYEGQRLSEDLDFVCRNKKSFSEKEFAELSDEFFRCCTKHFNA